MKLISKHKTHRSNTLQAGILCTLLMLLTGTTLQAQTGRVGINTTTPAAVLHVADSSVVATGNTEFNSTMVPPVQGPGSRMMWFEPRKAFRVGRVTNNAWDRDSIGNASIATGTNTLARGAHSVAMGSGTKALGSGSVALGLNTTAGPGAGTFAAGSNTKAINSMDVALGINTTASGAFSMATGSGSTASGLNSFATGSQTQASGASAASFGGGTIAHGIGSAAFGQNTRARSFTSFVIGRFNDSTAVSAVSVHPTDPLFIVGNGESNTSRKNALTLLQNGNLGLFTHTPAFRMHVANDNPADGGYAEGILVENTNQTVGEAAISFRNQAIPASRQWTIGVDQGPSLAFAYGVNFTGGGTHMAIDTLGRVGIRTTSPQAPLHVLRNNPSGGSFHPSALAIFESNSNSYLFLSHEDADETGILSGSQATLIRSAITFNADSSMHFRTGGNFTKMEISNNGNVGIGTVTPTARLHVNGTAKLGANGSILNEIIKASVTADLPSIAAGATLTQSFTVTNAALTSAISVSQGGAFTDGLVIASARVSAANTVQVRFVNTSAGAIDPPSMDYHFTLIR